MSYNTVSTRSMNNNEFKNGTSKIMTELKPRCDGRHTQCTTYAEVLSKIIDTDMTQEYFTKYLAHISGNPSSYNACLSTYNRGYQRILEFIIKSSQKYIVDTCFFSGLINNLSDDNLKIIVENQTKLDPSYIDKMIEQNNMQNGYHSTILIVTLFTNANLKQKTLKFIFSKLKVKQFLTVINKIKNSINTSNENIIADFIKFNLKEFSENTQDCIELIRNIPYKTAIIKELYSIVSKTSKKDFKLEILDKALNNLDKNIILTIFDTSKDIIPTDKNVDTLLAKVCASHGARGASNNRIIADIMDVFITYGLKVTKELIIKLLNKTCYINQIERFNIPIDQDILYVCSNFSYYPYKFDCKPPISVLIKECSKSDNLEIIKKLKEYGGIYNTTCLIEACKNPKNGRVIKFLVNECGVKANDDCVRAFQVAYHIDSLDIIIKGYNPKNDETAKSNENKFFEIDPGSLVQIQPRVIKLDKNDKNAEFTLKSKIKKFFDYKKKTIKYLEIYEIILKYLIGKKLVIGNYFVLNNELASILKLDGCMILHIDQVDNMITYFIDPVE